MLLEMYQQGKIRDASSTAVRAETKSLTLELTVKRLDENMDSLALTCQAMWGILRDRTSVTAEDLMAKIAEIDIRDGAADGKMGGGIQKCTKCDRTLNQRHQRCLYCGEAASSGPDHVFQS
jgi:hypothetical protein